MVLVDEQDRPILDYLTWPEVARKVRDGLCDLSSLIQDADAHIRFVAFDWMTMGQLLSLPMIVAGIYLLFRAYRKQEESG